MVHAPPRDRRADGDLQHPRLLARVRNDFTVAAAILDPNQKKAGEFLSPAFDSRRTSIKHSGTRSQFLGRRRASVWRPIPNARLRQALSCAKSAPVLICFLPLFVPNLTVLPQSPPLTPTSQP